MSHDTAVWLVLAVALIGANLPFVNNRWLALWPKTEPKHLGHHVLELVVLYMVVGAVGLGLEHDGGQTYPQGWEFYATTACLFLTLAFPGFVWRYLYKPKH